MSVPRFVPERAPGFRIVDHRSSTTYAATWDGFVYVAVVINTFALRIVGWRASRTAHAGFLLEVLKQALHKWKLAKQNMLVHRPDRESKYPSICYSKCIAESGIEPPVGSVGDSYDNALSESVIGLFKTELIERRGPSRSFEAIELATLAWVYQFNTRRLLGPIAHVPPAEAAANYFVQLETPAMAA